MYISRHPGRTLRLFWERLKSHIEYFLVYTDTDLFETNVDSCLEEMRSVDMMRSFSLPAASIISKQPRRKSGPPKRAIKIKPLSTWWKPSKVWIQKKWFGPSASRPNDDWIYSFPLSFLFMSLTLKIYLKTFFDII